MKEKIIYLAGALLFGVASWLVGTVYSISIDTAIIKDKLKKFMRRTAHIVYMLRIVQSVTIHYYLQQ